MDETVPHTVQTRGIWNYYDNGSHIAQLAGDSMCGFKKMAGISKWYKVGWFYWSIFEIIAVCFAVAIFDLVHEMEATRGLC